jgi:predicted nucleic acid-binding protein
VIVLDASVLIAYLDDTDEHHERAVDLLAREIDQDLGVSTLTLGEVLVGPARTGRLAPVVAAVKGLAMREIPLQAGSSARLARLRVETRLKMPDCCVLLAAESSGAGVASFDERLAATVSTQGLTLVT